MPPLNQAAHGTTAQDTCHCSAEDHPFQSLLGMEYVFAVGHEWLWSGEYWNHIRQAQLTVNLLQKLSLLHSNRQLSVHQKLNVRLYSVALGLALPCFWCWFQFRWGSGFGWSGCSKVLWCREFKLLRACQGTSLVRSPTGLCPNLQCPHSPLFASSSLSLGKDVGRSMSIMSIASTPTDMQSPVSRPTFGAPAPPMEPAHSLSPKAVIPSARGFEGLVYK